MENAPARVVATRHAYLAQQDLDDRVAWLSFDSRWPAPRQTCSSRNVRVLVERVAIRASAEIWKMLAKAISLG